MKSRTYRLSHTPRVACICDRRPIRKVERVEASHAAEADFPANQTWRRVPDRVIGYH